MADKLDMSLDEIIKQTRGRGGRNRGRGRSRVFRGSTGTGRGRGIGGVRRGGIQQRNRSSFVPATAKRVSPRNTSDGAWQHDMYEGATQGRGGFRNSVGGGVGKLLISNLDYGVSDSDIKELFSEFGNLRKAAVHYDRSGRSLGTAEVIFDNRSDADEAMKQYKGVPLDGREMNIQMVDGGSGPLQANRLGDSGGGGGDRPVRNSTRSNWGRPGSGRGRGGNLRGRGRGRGRGGSRGNTKIPTAEELDAQLDAYNAQMDTN